VSRRRLAILAALALLCAAPSAKAADPIMPLADVRAGMRCTAWSVIQGTEPVSFDAEVLDVIEGDRTEDARILLRTSGPAVDRTGIGQGFSGSPVYCPGPGGEPRNAGAISEGIGEYGNNTILATPIELVLGTRPTKASAARRDTALLASAHRLAGPLTVTGLPRSIASRVSALARKRGLQVITAPAGPAHRYQPITLRPGSALAVGLSTGDITSGAIGTVTYVDGNDIWAFGHPFDGVGDRSLLLQDAYIFGVINNPLGTEESVTYKYGAPGHDLGTLRADGLNGVFGTMGPMPSLIPATIHARDLDRGGRTLTLKAQVADERDVDLPTGGSPLAFVGSSTLVAAGTRALDAAPARLTGRMCAKITLRERRLPLRFCNRYVATGTGEESSSVPIGMALDVQDALTLVDDFAGEPIHVSGFEANVKLQRGLQQALLLDARAPATARPGQRIRVRLELRKVGGARFTRDIRVRVPAGVHGHRTLTLTGSPADSSDDLSTSLGAIIVDTLDEPEPGDELGPRTSAELADAIAAIHRYDGVTARFGGGSGERAAYRDPDLRISGRVRVPIRIG
jgi:hypothetical protein